MIGIVGALIILGSLVGGYLLYVQTDRLDRQIRAELEEGRGR